MNLLVRGGLVVTPEGVQPADVLIQAGAIVAIAPHPAGIAPEEAPGAEVVDATGCYVLPGGVDPHCHVVNDLEGASRAAAVGGTTTALTFTLPVDDEHPTVAVRRAHELVGGGRSRIDIGLHAMCYRPDALRPQDLVELEALGVDAVKIFLAYPELGIMASGGGLFRTMRAAAAAGLPVQVHCEDGELIEALVEQAAAEGRRGAETFAQVRPPAAEQVAVNRVLAVAALTGADCYITHLSSAGAIAHVRAARRDPDRSVATEACLHHVLLDDSEYRGERAGAFLVAPPLRSKDHVDAVREALLDGTIDGLGSDHSQHRTEVDSRLSDGTDSYGIAGIGARMPLLLSWGTEHGVPVERLAHLLATGPARAFGYAPQKGQLSVGSDGDLVVWDPNEDWTVDADSFPDGTGNSPYAGRRVRGRIRFVALRGQALVRDAQAVEPAPRGRLVVRQRGEGKVNG